MQQLAVSVFSLTERKSCYRTGDYYYFMAYLLIITFLLLLFKDI